MKQNASILAVSLLFSTALVPLPHANAAEWNRHTLGYEFLGLGGLQDDADPDQNGESNFVGRLVADNGLRFQARIEVEAQAGAPERGFFATEIPVGGTLVNPAVEFDNSLTGYEVGVDGSIGIGDVFGFQSRVRFGFDYADYTGSDTVENVNLPGGLGVTAVGVAPGVFINSPTDVSAATFNSDRYQFGGNVGLDKILHERDLGGGNNLIFSSSSGFRGGHFHQEDSLGAWTITPAFGANSNSNIEYNTDIKGGYYGAFVGFGATNVHVSATGFWKQFGISAGGGFNIYDYKVTDTVNAEVLNGLANVNQTIEFEQTDATFDVGVRLNAGFGKGNWAAGFGVGVDYGRTPSFDVSRPDSAAGGQPLQTQVELDETLSVTGLAYLTMRF